MHSNWENMTTKELCSYVIAHPKDDRAFHLWVDRVTANAPNTLYPPVTSEEAERILREKIEEKNPGWLAAREAESQPCDRALLKTMTRKELRGYVISHPKDIEAFHHFVDTAKPTSPWYPPVQSIEEMERLIQEHLDRKASEGNKE
jgi:(2Fe-2S) ferredoxin